jgi:DNA-binding CsgD family transcriptional regulator
MPTADGTTSLLGREGEQAELYDALSLALKGSPQVVLIGGDAGIGKTSLVSDLARRAEGLGVSVVVGHCLDIDAGMAFAAVIEAVRELVARSEDLDSRPCARRMRALLDPETPRSPEPYRMLEDLRQTVLEAAGAGPVMFVVEDMHWAGRSTQDFAVALSRRGRGRLLFVLTVRKDDLHRRHPARKALAEISAVPGARRVDLHPLDGDGIAGIVATTTGASVDPALVRTVLTRSEGNPLYAEELVTAGPQAIPERLSDLFLARVDAVAEGPREVLRVASVDGTRVDIETVGQVAHLDPGELDASLRELRDANLLRDVGDSLAFRHGLLREAVYEDLLPDERTRIHGDFAAVLQAGVDAESEPRLSLLSRLAFHWSAAHDLAHALQASERAGMVALRIGAPESVAHLERALSLWDVVADAQGLVGRAEIELVISLASAVGEQGDLRRWHVLNRQAVELLRPETDPLVASRAYSALAFSGIENSDLAGVPEAIRFAIEYAGDVATEERSYAYSGQAWLHCCNNQFNATIEAADRAIEDARTTASLDPLLRAMPLRYLALMYAGRLRDAVACIEEARDGARRAGMDGNALMMTGHLAAHLIEGGRVAEGMKVARAGHREGELSGLLVQAAYCGVSLVWGLTWMGQLGEAETLLDELREMGLPEGPWQRERTELLLARGVAEAGIRLVDPTRTYDEQVAAYADGLAVLTDFLLAVLCDDGRGSRAIAESYLAHVDSCDSPVLAATAARIGYHALALAPSAPFGETSELTGRAARLLEQARNGLTDEWRGSCFGVQLAMAEAYAGRVAGEPAVERFRSAAELAEPFGAFFVLEPRLELAEELLAHGGRDEGRQLLVDCWTAAQAMGAGGLERRAVRLATRTRVPLPVPASSEGPLSRLTPRERQVLEQVATGATNKTIAEVLVISEKTVSVHVSNVLAKLGVENRGAAAALARSLVG